MKFYTVHCTSLDGETDVTIRHLVAESAEQALVLAETYFRVKAESVEDFKNDNS